MTETGKVLVIGASGFLGGHVTKTLVLHGRDIRIMVRKTSDTRATDHLEVEKVYGDVSDKQSLLDAMEGCSTVFYCVVDTRAWLKDPSPLYRTNIDGLRNALDAALECNSGEGVQKFVFTSTFAIIGVRHDRLSNEEDAFNWHDGPDYVRCRAQAEDMVLRYAKEKGLPAVACCVGNTYGDGDFVPTPHGKVIADVAKGRMPFYWQGGGSCVGIRDAAEALILAEEKGRIGERYIITERWLDYQEMFAIAAKAAKQEAPTLRLPMSVMYLMAYFADFVAGFTGKENRMSVNSLKCSTQVPNTDNSKAKQELGWQPRPIEESIQEAVDFYLNKPRAH